MADVSQLKTALNALIKRHKIGSRVSKPVTRRRRTGGQVVSRFNAGGGGEGGGVMSPVTETLGSRQYWPATTLTSTDGLFTIVEYGAHAKTITMTDAAGAPFVMHLKQPPNDGV